MRGIATVLSLALALVATAHAEPGDYTPEETYWNLFFPRPADNPVTPEQGEGVYPLLKNPVDFEDRFDPRLYFQWQTIQLHPDTGAVCGNGTPYKIFVNRAPNTSNMVIYKEGGGACWDYEGCTGASELGARNPNGIPDNYLSLENLATALVSPFVWRQNPWSRTKVQAWTIVYIPYCTGDTYTGDKVAIYDNPDPSGQPLVWHHNGLRNDRAAIAWLKENLEQPVQTLFTGCSAGGTGTMSNYFHARRDMDPEFGFLLNDSGPLFSAIADAGGGRPSLSYPLHQQIIGAWGLDTDNGEGISPLDYMAQEVPGFDPADLGTINAGVAARFPRDRIGHVQFWQDYNYSRYSYEEFYEFLYNEPNDQLRKAYTHLLWWADTAAFIDELDALGNYGVYIPFVRELNDSHCATIVDFLNGDIQEQGLELSDFIDSVMVLNAAQPPYEEVMDAVETDWSLDPAKEVNWLYVLIDWLRENGP